MASSTTHANHPTGHCRAQRQALEYYSTGASTIVIPETVLSEAQEYDWAACYNEVDRWHTPELESTHKQEKKDAKPVRVYKGNDESEGAKLWCLKVEKDGLCTGCGGKRIPARS
ncbi:hypothetical protein EKO04_000596 [Ascochyta lentis]|uniref:Uncharacterized protein n=1 Tax=Ascochyta lentis TaxID=205686 RepID=A0A8H7JEG1_9PLEO|nr:hypothetical protein EKO04_000596 [Ascochyta lentis]